jgi:hypothetical protein
LRSVVRQESIQAARQGVTIRELFEQSQRDQGIQQNSQRAQVALKSAGEFPSRQRRGGQSAEEIQLRSGGQHRSALVGASQSQDFVGRTGLMECWLHKSSSGFKCPQVGREYPSFARAPRPIRPAPIRILR